MKNLIRKIFEDKLINITNSTESKNIPVLYGQVSDLIVAMSFLARQFETQGNKVQVFDFDVTNDFDEAKTHDTSIIILIKCFELTSFYNNVDLLQSLRGNDRVYIFSSSFADKGIFNFRNISIDGVSLNQIKEVLDTTFSIDKKTTEMLTKVAEGSFCQLQVLLLLRDDKNFKDLFIELKSVPNILFNSETWHSLTYYAARICDNEQEKEIANALYYVSLYMYTLVPVKNEAIQDVFFVIISRLVSYYLDNKDPMKAVHLLRELSGQINNNTSQNGKLVLMTTYSRLADELQDNGQYVLAEGFYGKAIESGSSYGALKDCLAIKNNLAILYQAEGRYDDALRLLKTVLKERKEMGALDSVSEAALYNNIAGIYDAKNMLSMALDYYKKAMSLYKHSTKIEDTDKAATYNNIAGVYVKMNEHEKALNYYSKALKIYESKHGDDYLTMAITYNNIGLLYQNLGEFEKALDYNEKALAIRIRVLGEDHPDTATSYNNISLLRMKMGDLNAAIEYAERACAIREHILGDKHLDTALVYYNLADMYREIGEYKKAERCYEKAVPVIKKSLKGNHPYYHRAVKEQRNSNIEKKCYEYLKTHAQGKYEIKREFVMNDKHIDMLAVSKYSKEDVIYELKTSLNVEAIKQAMVQLENVREEYQNTFGRNAETELIVVGKEKEIEKRRECIDTLRNQIGVSKVNYMPEEVLIENLVV